MCVFRHYGGEPEQADPARSDPPWGQWDHHQHGSPGRPHHHRRKILTGRRSSVLFCFCLLFCPFLCQSVDLCFPSSRAVCCDFCVFLICNICPVSSPRFILCVWTEHCGRLIMKHTGDCGHYFFTLISFISPPSAEERSWTGRSAWVSRPISCPVGHHWWRTSWRCV